MKSDKQRILEAYSEDLKAMYGVSEGKSSDVKKWIVIKPKYISEQHNIVDAYALLAEDDNYRQNKMRILNEQIILKGKISKVKEIMDFAEKEMERYIEGSQFENSGRFCEARDNFDEAKITYDVLVESYHDDDEEEEMDEGEGLDSPPTPEKHSATGTVDGGDSSEGKASTTEIDDELDQVTEAKQLKIKFKEDMDKAKMDMDDIDDDDSEEMDEVFKKYKEAKKKYKEACADDDDMMDEGEGEKPAPAPSKHDATDSVDGGLVTKQDLDEDDDDDDGDDGDDDDDDDKREMNDIKENKEAYMKYAKGIIGGRDLSKMSDEDTKALFNKIDKGWNSKDEPGKDGPV